MLTLLRAAQGIFGAREASNRRILLRGALQPFVFEKQVGARRADADPRPIWSHD